MIDLNTCVYHEWDSLVPQTEQLIKNESTQLVIPTVDIVRYSFLITAVLMHKKPVLLTGKNVHYLLLNSTLSICISKVTVV